MVMLILAVIALYLIFGEPFVGTHEYKKLVRNVNIPGARMRFYRNIVCIEWALTITTLATLLFGQVSLKTFGFQSVDLTAVNSTVKDLLIAFVAGLFVQTVLLLKERINQKNGNVNPKLLNAVKSVVALLPTNNRERWTYAFVSLTAGICEEVLFRGLIIYLLRRLDPSLGTVWLVVISSVIFGFAHAYQGVQGIIASACVGAMFAVLFVTTHTLFIPIILHALIDLRALLIPLPHSTSRTNSDELNTTV
jgi:uncharacterized protein